VCLQVGPSSFTIELREGRNRQIPAHVWEPSASRISTVTSCPGTSPPQATAARPVAAAQQCRMRSFTEVLGGMQAAPPQAACSCASQNSLAARLQRCLS
jgi:hypothetical protein